VVWECSEHNDLRPLESLLLGWYADCVFEARGSYKVLEDPDLFDRESDSLIPDDLSQPSWDQ